MANTDVTSQGGRGRVLVVDDDAALAEMLTIVLRQEGFDSRVCPVGDRALADFRDYHPDVVLLDLMLPGKDGIDVCREIRAESGVPIVMLTAKSDTIDVVVGLESGADDYVVKPFKPKELVARIRARVRRFDEPAPEALTIGDLTIDVAGHVVARAGEPIALTPLEFDLLVCLARKPWQVFTREVLLEQVWGYRHAADTRLVNVHVQRLRSKVEHDPENPEIVVTVRGVGYKAGTTASHGRAREGRRASATSRDRVAPVDPGPRRHQHAPALGRRGVAGRLGAPPADHRRPRAPQDGVGGRGDHPGDRRGAARPLGRQRQRLRRGHPADPARRDAGLARVGAGLRDRAHRPHRRDQLRGGVGRRHPQHPGRARRTASRSGSAPPSSRATPARRRTPTRRSATPPPPGGPRCPGVVTGSQVTLPADGGTYTLYYLFPMSEQQDTLTLVGRALVTGGGLLLVLVGGLTWLVTRQVVTPVRLARRVAERLASGRLEERMHVRGDDDIARLGTSFNQMAASLQKQIRQLEELSRVQRRFVADVSHELRTPLTTVRMAGDVLHDARDRFDPPTARAAELLQNELDRFEMLLADLLEISRFDAGRRRARPRGRQPRRPRAPGGRVDARPGRAPRHRGRRTHPGPGRRSPRSTPGAWSASSATWSPTRSTTPTAATSWSWWSPTTTPPRWRSATTASDCGPATRRWCSTGSGGPTRRGRAPPAAPASGLSISLEDAHLHGGWLQAWGEPGGGAQFRLTLPRRAGDRIGASPLPLVPEDAAVGRVGADYARLDRRASGRKAGTP